MPNGVQYAEQQLGVNETYDELQVAYKQYESQSDNLNKLKHNKRDREEDVLVSEQDIITKLRVEHSSMSQAQMDKLVKSTFFTDPAHKILRDAANAAAYAVEVVEAEVKLWDRKMNMLTARLNELGGYFNYLASLKNAETMRQGSYQLSGVPKNAKPPLVSDPWSS